MHIENEDIAVRVYPFIDEAKDTPFSGHLRISKDYDCAPDIAGRLQLNIVFANGMTPEMWNEFKEAGDKAFELAAQSRRG